jgi:hypothetical protein
MVNWREDVEFCYALAILVSAILIFFGFYDSRGLQYAGELAGGIVAVLIIVGVGVFETDRARDVWERLEKSGTSSVS